MKGCRSYDHGQWCFNCSTYHHPTKSCNCGIQKPTITKRKRTCEGCGVEVYINKNHRCHYIECNFCSKYYQSNDPSHRCPIHTLKDSDHYLPFIGEPENNPKKSPAIHCFDLESGLKYRPNQTTLEFETDENGFFVEGVNGVICHERPAFNHVPNLAICKNVFTNEPEKIFLGLDDLLHYAMTYNDGNNIFLAHNSNSKKSCLFL
jgi:hypothetical protein